MTTGSRHRVLIYFNGELMKRAGQSVRYLNLDTIQTMCKCGYVIILI